MTAENRKKSPRAPSLALKEAIERGLKVYERERLHPTPTDVVAQALGYKSANNGAALSLLASLRYFGILIRPKEGFLAVAKDLEAYKFAPDEKLRRDLLLGFLKTPPLYRELLEKYEAGLPSDANLKFELIQRGFSPQSSEPILAAFLRSVEFVDYYHANADTQTVDKPSVERSSSLNQENKQIQIEPADKATWKVSLETPEQADIDDSRLDRIPVRLPGNRKAWLIIPSPFFEADKARLKAQIDLLLSEDEA